MPKLSKIIDEEEQQELITAVRIVAVSIAELWDILWELENSTGKAIEYPLEMFSCFAGKCRMEPDLMDLGSDADVMALLDDMCTLE